MTTYPIHTVESAPDGSKQALRGLREAFGLVPNLAATMANSPALVNTFVAAFGQFGGADFTGGERQVLLLTNAVTNRCSWAVAFHSTMALKEGVAPADVEAIRRRSLPTEPRLAALSTVTRQLIEKRGHLDDHETKEFTAAGFDEHQLFDVIAGLSISTTANYAGNVARPPLEAPFQAQAWADEH
jgi:alkylhydroperoxidase family enzyme